MLKKTINLPDLSAGQCSSCPAMAEVSAETAYVFNTFVSGLRLPVCFYGSRFCHARKRHGAVEKCCHYLFEKYFAVLDACLMYWLVGYNLMAARKALYWRNMSGRPMTVSLRPKRPTFLAAMLPGRTGTSRWYSVPPLHRLCRVPLPSV